MAKTKEIIIIGAGPGGLASAIQLAARGFRVRILERLPTVGGRTSAIRADGFSFDLGPTFFLYPQILKEIFAEAGRNLDTEVDLRRVDPNYRLVFGDTGASLDISSKREELKRQIARFSPRDAAALDGFLDAEREKFARFSSVLQQPFLGWKDLCRKSALDLLPILNPHLSLEAYLRKHFEDPRVRLAFCFQSKYLGMSPFKCPSVFSILSFLEHEFGVFHPIGGCAAITESMANVARGAGVEIRLDEPVEEVLFEGRRAVGVRTREGVYRADAIVMNADFARAMKTLVPDRLRRRWSDRKIEKKQFSCSTFMLYLGVDGRDDLPHHNIYMSGKYERNLDEIERQQLLSEDPSFYVQNACVTDPGLAPKGQSTLYLLAPVPHQTKNIDWKREAGPFRERLLDQMSKAGFANVRERIRYERVITPDDWDQGYNVHLGATFNLAHTFKQMLHLRPRNRFEDVDGVYLVGGGTHPGSGLPVIFESARITTKLLCEDLGVAAPARRITQMQPLAEEPVQLPVAAYSGLP